VLVDGVTHVLPGVPAGSGAKFMDDAGNTLWTKGKDEGLWTPLERALRLSGASNEDRTDNMLDVVARLKDGVTLDQARAELTVIAARLEREFPKENEKTGATVAKMSAVGDRNRLLLYALCGAALCILLLACANLANLLLVRALGREREIAVRTALGAGRDRLARQLMTESGLLVALGVATGFGVATLAIPALTRLVPISLPIAGLPSLDLRMLIAAGLLIALVGIGFGVLPALRGTGSLDALREGARSGGGRKQWTRSVLVMVEVMASVVLLISSGLLMRAMWQLQSQNPGFRAEGVLTRAATMREIPMRSARGARWA
jgi:putative ABC transport system permease protein